VREARYIPMAAGLLERTGTSKVSIMGAAVVDIDITWVEKNSQGCAGVKKRRERVGKGIRGMEGM
jgi:hypothetical protein